MEKKVDEMTSFEAEILIWLNDLSGNVNVFDDFMRIAASDYLMPIVFSLGMLGLWFSGKTALQRSEYQIQVIVGISALALANVIVWLCNITINRPRPFIDYPEQINLLFYPPTDPSFPANPVAVGFAVATACWVVNRNLGRCMYACAVLFGISRLYAGVFYPTDIIGGAAVGIASYGFATYLRRFLEPLVTSFLRLIRGLSAA